MIRFEDPAYLFVLVMIPLWLWARRDANPGTSLGFSSVKLVRKVKGKGMASIAWIPLFLKICAFTLLVGAFARPQMEYKTVVSEREGIDIFLAADVSSSMADPVMSSRKSNLEMAVDVMETFAQNRKEDRIGLISFAAYPELVCPLTMDRSCLNTFLNELKCEEQGSSLDGTAIGAALAEAARRMADSGKMEAIGETTLPERDKVVILVTDGEENRFSVAPLDAAKLCAQLGIRVYTIAAAKAGKNKASTKIHEGIAAITNGITMSANSMSDLKKIYSRIDELEKRPLEERGFIRRSDLYIWLLLPAAILFFLEYIISGTLLLRLP